MTPYQNPLKRFKFGKKACLGNIWLLLSMIYAFGILISTIFDPSKGPKWVCIFTHIEGKSQKWPYENLSNIESHGKSAHSGHHLRIIIRYSIRGDRFDPPIPCRIGLRILSRERLLYVAKWLSYLTAFFIDYLKQYLKKTCECVSILLGLSDPFISNYTVIFSDYIILWGLWCFESRYLNLEAINHLSSKIEINQSFHRSNLRGLLQEYM